MDLYQPVLYPTGQTLSKGKAAKKPESAKRVIARKGRLPLADYVRSRVRYFSDGAVFGSQGYVEEVFEANRKRYGKKRKSGARRMKELEGEFYVVRDLQLEVFG